MASKSFVLEFDGYWRESAIDSIPAKSGIYGVYAAIYNPGKQQVTLNRLLYIGESKNVRDRIKNHEKKGKWRSELRQEEVLCFNMAPISPATDRERAEAAMIYEHKPPTNTEYLYNFPFEQTTITTRGHNALMKTVFTVFPTSQGSILTGGLYGLGGTLR